MTLLSVPVYLAYFSKVTQVQDGPKNKLKKVVAAEVFIGRTFFLSPNYQRQCTAWAK